jgi:hypothetical protein
MKKPSASILAFLFVIGLIFTYFAEVKGMDNIAIGIAVCVVAMAATYVMAPQIDWWWYKKHPRDLDPMFGKLFQLHLPFYQRLSEAEKLRFRQRVDWYLMAIEFIIPSQDEEKKVPEDLQHWLSAFRTMLYWGKPEDIADTKFEKIVAYMKPFPSQQFPKHLHSSEHFEEDGVLLFALAPMLHSVMQPTQCFNPVLYEYCNLFQLKYGSGNIELTASQWVDLEQISRFSQEQILKTVGLPEVNIRSVAMSFYILFPEAFRRILPKESEQIKALLGF